MFIEVSDMNHIFKNNHLRIIKQRKLRKSMEEKYTLGTIAASEALIKDLYIDLRIQVNKWAEITKQTPQARMGYIGQHLVSVVSGYAGGKSGARGRDLVISNTEYGEIKTCYKVDQLGKCKDCNEPVSILETECSSCGSQNIERKDDSKWLIGIRNDDEFHNILDPEKYYFVLFEFEDYLHPKNSVIDAYIWTVDPKNIGFAYCMFDYYLNIRSKSKSKAPFNMWPHSFKFLLTKPHMIYKAKIYPDNRIKTIIFPTLNNTEDTTLGDLQLHSGAKTIEPKHIISVIKRFDPDFNKSYMKKKELLGYLEDLKVEYNIGNNVICDAFAKEIYLPLLKVNNNRIPAKYKEMYPDLR